jgi:hypothetical protein
MLTFSLLWLFLLFIDSYFLLYFTFFGKNIHTYIVTYQDGCVALCAAVLHKHADVYEYILEKGNPDINAILPV